MTDTRHLQEEEARLKQSLRASQEGAGEEPSAQHDAAILGAAHAAGEQIRRRTRAGLPTWVPIALAASLLLGFGIGRTSWLTRDLRAPARLTVPVQMSVRGAGGESRTEVERADPAVWYRYIQELVFSGQTELAEQHLRRFRELHPDFVYQP